MSRADALALAGQGWSVFPTREKRPLTPSGFRDASASPSADWPDDAQTAIAIPEGHIVVDVDEQAGLDSLEREHGPLPPTLTALSGKRGEHRWYKTNGTPTATLTQRKLAPGVDTRVGGKGYVVAPPSLHHETGRPYRWAEPTLPIADAPAWMLAALAKVEPTTAEPAPERSAEHLEAARAYLATMPPAIEGRDSDGKGTTGGTYTFKICVDAVRGHMLTDDAAFEALKSWNARCIPPWDDYGLRRKIHEAATKGAMPWGGLIPDVDLLAALRSPHTQAAPSDLEILGVDRIFAVLPDVEYLVQALDMAPGAPMLIAGYGYSGKTAAAQQMALDLARPDHTGAWMNPRPVWDKFAAARRGKVLHVDYEQGQLTLRRYQRLARAAGVSAEELRGYLNVISLPHLFLLPNGMAAFERACEGMDLAIFDSLRAAVPGVEENSSDFRRPLDALTAISEKHRCVMLVIHHARKPNQDSKGGAKMAIRGSGAIFDACSSVLVFEGEKGKPTQVTHEKARNSGITTDDFELVIEDVASAGGFRVRAADVVVKSAKERVDEQTEADVAKIREYLAVHQRFTNRNELRTAMAVSTTRVSAAMGIMLTRGELIYDGTARSKTYFLNEAHKP